MQASFETQLTDLKRLINTERPLRDKLPPDYNFRNLYGYSLLELAIIEGDIALCQHLIRVKEVDWRSLHPRTKKNSLFYAILHLHKSLAVELLRLGATLSELGRADLYTSEARTLFDALAREELRRTRTLYPQQKNNTIAVNKLLLAAELGDLPKFRSLGAILQEYADDILERAVANNRINIVKECERQGIVLKGRYTLLHLAASYGAGNCLAYLLYPRFELNIHAEDKEGNNALLLAAKFGHLACVRFLLEHGAHYLAADAVGKNLFYYLESETEKCALGLTPHQYTTLMRHNSLFTQQIRYPLPKGYYFSYAQEDIIHILQYYLELHRRDTHFFRPNGYCDGLVFLLHYLNALQPVFPGFHLHAFLQELICWDGSFAALNAPPKHAATTPFATLGDCMETLFSILTVLQSMTRLAGLTKDQGDRMQQLGVLGSRVHLTPILPTASYRFDANELEVFLTYAACCKGLCLDILSYHHASTVFIDEHRHIFYYNSNVQEGQLHRLHPGDLLSLLTFGHIIFADGDFKRSILEYERHEFDIRVYRLDLPPQQDDRQQNCFERGLFAFAKDQCMPEFRLLFDMHLLAKTRRYAFLLESLQKDKGLQLSKALVHFNAQDVVGFAKASLETTALFREAPSVLDALIARLISLIPEYQEAISLIEAHAKQAIVYNTAQPAARYFISEEDCVDYIKTLAQYNTQDEPLLFALFSLAGAATELLPEKKIRDALVELENPMYADCLTKFIQKYDLKLPLFERWYSEAAIYADPQKTHEHKARHILGLFREQAPASSSSVQEIPVKRG